MKRGLFLCIAAAVLYAGPAPAQHAATVRSIRFEGARHFDRFNLLKQSRLLGRTQVVVEFQDMLLAKRG